LWADESFRHDADDGEAHAIDGELPPQDVPRTTESRLPEPRADYRDESVRSSASDIVSGRDRASGHRIDAE
jgi:hypothetical protein